MAKKDPTKEKQAVTKEDVEQQDSATRLWQSLNQSYDRQREQTNENYEKAISQTDRAAQNRGMGRSSYNIQTQANLRNQQVKAQTDIDSAQIADYQNRLTDLESKEQENERWERQFGLQERQVAAAEEQNAWSRAFSEKQYEAGRADTAWSQNFQQKQADISQQNTERQFGLQERQLASSEAQNEWQRNFSEKQFGLQERQVASSEAQNEWQRNFSEQQFAETKNQNAWQQGMQEKQFAANQEQNAWERAFSEKQFAQSQQQWEAQQEQWREEFDYQKMTAEQQLNYNFVTYAIQNGKDVSDEMLQKAGLSREDFNSMKAQTQTLGGTNGTPAWKRAGFSSKEDYAEAQAAGYTDPTKWEEEKLRRKAQAAYVENTLDRGPAIGMVRGGSSNRAAD